MRRIVLTLLLVLLATSSLEALSDGAVLANDGRVLHVRADSYGAIFPGGHQLPPGRAILALEELRPDGSTVRQVVPGTVGPDTDASPSIAYDEASDSLAIVWEMQESGGSTTLQLVSRSTGAWSTVREITGHTASRKWSPRVVITQDRDASSGLDRTIFHIVWSEGMFGFETTFYSPVVVSEGRYVGSNPVIRLADTDPPPGVTPAPGHALLRAPSEERGSDRGTIVVSAAASTTGRLLSFDAKVHPQVMGRIADIVRDRILEAVDPGDLESMVDDVRAHIIIAGAGFQPGTLIPHLANQAEDSLRNLFGSGDLVALAAGVRAHIIIAGDRWLFPQRRPGSIRIFDAAGGADEVSHIVTLTDVAGRPLPEIEPEARSPRVLLSGDGDDALVAWQVDGQWRYLESRPGGWTSAQSMPEAVGGNEDAVLDLFHRRIFDR